MKNYLILACMFMICMEVGCDQPTLVERQQKEIDKLKSQIEELKKELQYFQSLKFESFLETSLNNRLTSQSRLTKADPVLKSMINGFPHPRDNNWQLSNSQQVNEQLQKLKPCPIGCIVT